MSQKTSVSEAISKPPEMTSSSFDEAVAHLASTAKLAEAVPGFRMPANYHATKKQMIEDNKRGRFHLVVTAANATKTFIERELGQFLFKHGRQFLEQQYQRVEKESNRGFETDQTDRYRKLQREYDQAIISEPVSEFQKKLAAYMTVYNHITGMPAELKRRQESRRAKQEKKQEAERRAAAERQRLLEEQARQEAAQRAEENRLREEAERQRREAEKQRQIERNQELLASLP